MGRLIDADELNELMTSEWFLDSLAANESPREIKKKLENAIDSVPLAYGGMMLAYGLAIPIVEKGGVE